MSKSSERLAPNLMDVDSHYLEYMNEQLVMLAIDTEHLAMALQAVQTDDVIFSGVLNAIRIALCSNAASAQDLSDQLDKLLTSKGVDDA